MATGKIPMAYTGLKRSSKTNRKSPDGPARDILIVDDEDDIRDTLASILRDEGYRVHTARHGVEALEIMGATLPAMIITDLTMPFMDGRQFVEALHANARLKEIPTIVITAGANAGSFPSTKVFGKPLNLDTLLRTIHAYMS